MHLGSHTSWRRRREGRARVPRLAAPSGASFELREVEGKGIGAIATKALKKGERIFEEGAFMVLLPQTRRYLSWQGDPIFRQEDEDFLLGVLERKDREGREEFWGLCDCLAREDGGRKKTAFGVVRTNALPLGPLESSTLGAVFLAIARFNHSCLPNVHFSWHERARCMRLHAAVDIAAGDELCISYIGLQQAKFARQQRLRGSFDFDCACAACSLSGEAAAASDRARSRLQTLANNVASVGARDPGEGAGMVAEMVELIDAELAGWPGEKMECLYEGFQMARRKQDLPLAEKWLEGAYENAAWAEGEDSHACKLLGGCLAEFRSNPR